MHTEENFTKQNIIEKTKNIFREGDLEVAPLPVNKNIQKKVFFTKNIS
jgi:hypothetical protein